MYKMDKLKPVIWRESSSLILVKLNDIKNHENDYEMLMIKRSDKTAYSVNQCVFPGGMFDKSDESVEWLKYFEEFGVSQRSLKELVLVDDLSHRPRILSPQGDGCYDRFFKRSFIWAREISLRINAIRETFEEVGILICRTRDQLNSDKGYCNVQENYNKVEWQKRVHEDQNEFLSLCRKLNVIPDLWSLYEWSVWASPAIFSKGFETAFFIAFLQENPKMQAEESEVKDIMWKRPTELLQMSITGEIYILPPQTYELSRFIRLSSYKKLFKFARERSRKGCTLLLPVTYLCTDGVVTVLPGDDFYIANPSNIRSPITMNCTMIEFREKTNHIHRIQNTQSSNRKILSNIQQLNGHLSPINLVDFNCKL